MICKIFLLLIDKSPLLLRSKILCWGHGLINVIFTCIFSIKKCLFLFFYHYYLWVASRISNAEKNVRAEKEIVNYKNECTESTSNCRLLQLKMVHDPPTINRSLLLFFFYSHQSQTITIYTNIQYGLTLTKVSNEYWGSSFFYDALWIA